jgi:hypothetical protein
MRVLVCIEVRGPEPGIENPTDLAQQFIVYVDAAESDRSRELGHGSRKGRLTDEYKVNTDIECRILASKAHRVVESRAGRHERSGGKNAFAMGLDDTLVDVARETEIVSVNHQPAHVRKWPA